MKKKHLFLKFGVLTASVLLTACASRDEIDISDTPLADGKIKAQFNISIPQSYKSAKTRTTDNAVQEGAEGNIEKFRGLEDIFLFPFMKGTATDVSTLTSKGRIRLSQILKPTVTSGNYTPNTIPDKNLLKGNNAVLFGDVDVTIGTDHFLFYGHAIDMTTGNKFMNGSLVPYDVSTPETPVMLDKTSYASITPTNLSFQLQRIKDDEEDASTKEGTILTYLNSILQAEATVGSNVIKWRTTNNLDLKILYDKFKSMRAGSTDCLRAAIEMLYFKGLGSRVNGTDDGEVTKLSQAIATAIKAKATVDETNQTLSFTTDIPDYPVTMPAGSAVLSTTTASDGTESFTYVLSEGSYFVDATALNVPAKERYVYPANLYYFGNSGIKVSKQLMTDKYKNDNTTGKTSAELWKVITDDYTDGTAIASDTKSIAITDQVQYAVGRLDVKVSTYKDGTGAPTKLLDATEKDANKVDINDLRVTGILIGGQRSVDWKFESENATTEYFIYDNIKESCNLKDNSTEKGGIVLTNKAFDNIINSTTESTTTIGFNHTLVLQTKKYTAASGENPATGDETVNVLVELQNYGPAFEGKDGTVGKGCKFYLLGKLDMTKLSSTDKKSDYIFQQDYITCANFTIASLKNAVNVIPDLRDPQIELGLSVDLSWKEGNTFNYEIP